MTEEKSVDQKVADLPLTALLGQLKLGQIWAILAALFALIAGASGLGHHLGSANSEIQAERARLGIDILQAEVAALEKELDKTRLAVAEANGKDIFLSMFLRYMSARNEYLELNRGTSRQEEVDESYRAYVKAGNEFDQWFEGRLHENMFVYKKGQSESAVVSFADGTRWDLPRELAMTCQSMLMPRKELGTGEGVTPGHGGLVSVTY